MKPMNPQEIEAVVNARFRIFLVFWAALLVSVALLTTLSVALPSKGTPNVMLSYALAFLGIMNFGLSFLLKQSLTRKAIDQNDIAGLQSAFIVGLALAESTALFGLVNHFATGWSTISWLLFAVSAAGILLKFPSKEQIRAVSYPSNQQAQ
ncbi:MAG TPA: hypothetical protein VE961_28070 [Pyrinomonadaceae bacterium]|nr:hypothetical protein [Pyrinomonadaceae bacterium]